MLIYVPHFSALLCVDQREILCRLYESASVLACAGKHPEVLLQLASAKCSSASIRSPFPAVRGCQTFLLVKAALLPWPTAHSAMPSKQQVLFTFSVVPALGVVFGVSAPGFYAAITFDPPCSAIGRGNSCLAPAGKLPVVKTSSRFHRCLQL